MLVLLSCPKAFSGGSARIQRLAVESWLRIGVTPHLVGPTADVESIPDDLAVDKTVTDGRSDVSILPDFNDLLEVLPTDGYGLYGYANADIVFPEMLHFFQFEDGKLFLGTSRLPRKFLVTGSRWDLQQGVEVPPLFDTRIGPMGSFIGESIQAQAVKLGCPDAMDYFIFPSGLFEDLKTLIVGRGGYDNALIAYCLRRSIPVIDVSREFPVLHQFHGYEHKSGGKREVYLGDEAMFNRRTHDIVHSPPNALDADYILEDGQLKSVPLRCGVLRRVELTLRYRWGMKWLSYPFRVLQRILRTQERITEREMKKTQDSILAKAT